MKDLNLIYFLKHKKKQDQKHIQFQTTKKCMKNFEVHSMTMYVLVTINTY